MKCFLKFGGYLQGVMFKVIRYEGIIDFIYYELCHTQATNRQLDPSPGRPGIAVYIQFFNAVKALSEAIFESEKQITENIAQTKYSLTEGQVNLGFSFNQFMRISEHKFTENVPVFSVRKLKRGGSKPSHNKKRRKQRSLRSRGWIL